MSRIYSLFTFLIFSSGLAAQQAPQLATDSPDHAILTAVEGAGQFAATITEEDLRSYLSVLASDSLQGRETGTEGQRMAADFIAHHFETLGLPKIGDPDPETGEPSYFQYIAFTSERWDRGGLKLKVGDTEFGVLKDFYAYPSENADRGEAETSEVLFLGYGIDDEKYSDYAGVDAAGKTILIYAGEPMDAEGRSYVTGDTTVSDWSKNRLLKLEAAHKHGVERLLVIDPDIKRNISQNRMELFGGRMKMGWGENPEERFANSFFISSTVARAIVGDAFEDFVKVRDSIKTTGEPAQLALKTSLVTSQKKLVNQLTGSNVLGYIEGADEKLKDEVVVVSAHYDHLGMRGNSIFNGADDNGSGSSMVMELAQAFAEAKKAGAGPRRSVLFLLVSGEEKGLLGSEFYSEHPVFPLENTVADVNVDMIGRTDKKHRDDPNYIYVIGADRLSTMLHKINEAANQQFVNLELDYTYNAEDDPNRFYYRSDHYNFAKHGIPSVFFFSGTHEDYHRPTDTVDKIMFDKMVKIGQLVFYTTWELANRDERIQVDVPQEN
ncbi:MAG: peptidase M28 [Saprospirales bacterium]|nr:peptidase M28 [Saprospirales bacterium]